ncbi:uncharacterized protein Fot_36221 [Forsythia ovata]|uniref:Uncharacterized protein n=1 Tax=Forsythia ovata TaxID=205694 RepID=A0ABD1SRL9_9LAMI
MTAVDVEKNDRFKKMRASQTLIMHTTSRKGFARLEAEMGKIKAYSKNVTSPNKHSLKDDGVARVLGPECRGRVRGLGFGATPSKLNALVHNHSLQTQLQELRNEINELHALFQMKNKSIEEEDNLSLLKNQVNIACGTPSRFVMIFLAYAD